MGRRPAHRVRVDAARLRRPPRTQGRAQAAVLEDPRDLRLHGRRLRLEGRCREVLDHRVALRDAARPARALHPHPRRGEHRGGNRSATLQQLRIGGKGGRITGLEHTSWANVGQGRWVANPTGPTNTLYDIANLSSKSYKVVTNAGSLAAFRAPGYVEGTFALESAVDELAEKMGVDPLTLRRKHAASPKDPMVGKRYSDKHLIECYRIGAAEIGWQRRRSGGIRGSAPHRRRGIGMATQIWGGGGGPPAYATVHVNPDGTVVLTAGTQDIGTGTRTVIAQVCADELGVDLDAIQVRIGDTDHPYGPISAGSVTTASMGPAVRIAARDAKEQLLGAAAGVLETPKAELRLEGGVIVSKGARTPLGEILSKVENNTVIGK